jgi:hypothetical protein
MPIAIGCSSDIQGRIKRDGLYSPYLMFGNKPSRRHTYQKTVAKPWKWTRPY